MSTASSTGPGKEGFPAPAEGFVLTHLLIVADQDRSREFYRKVMGAEVIRERDRVVLRMSNSWLILNAGGGPTDDKPNVIAAPPQSAHVLTSALNIRVADVASVIGNGEHAVPSSSPSPRTTEPRSVAT
jgi:lactoylglutathione lyase